MPENDEHVSQTICLWNKVCSPVYQYEVSIKLCTLDISFSALTFLTSPILHIFNNQDGKEEVAHQYICKLQLLACTWSVLHNWHSKSNVFLLLHDYFITGSKKPPRAKTSPLPANDSALFCKRSSGRFVARSALFSSRLLGLRALNKFSDWSPFSCLFSACRQPTAVLSSEHMCHRSFSRDWILTWSLIKKIWIWEYQTEFRILLDTLSHFVHLLNVLVRWNLVKQIFAASGDKLFVVWHTIYHALKALLASQFLTGLQNINLLKMETKKREQTFRNDPFNVFLFDVLQEISVIRCLLQIRFFMTACPSSCIRLIAIVSSLITRR